MPPIRKAAHVPTPTRQASIGDYFTKRSGPAPPSVSKSRLPKANPEPTEHKAVQVQPEPAEPKAVQVQPTPIEPEAILVESDASDVEEQVSDEEDASLSLTPEAVDETNFPTYPVVKGLKEANFEDDRRDWDGRYYKIIGTTTKKINFDCGCVITDKILNQIAALDAKICKSITWITFKYTDVGYDAHNTAKDVTDAGIIRLAQACPNLTNFLLPGVGGGVTDAALIALFKHCPKLSQVDISGTTNCGKPALTGPAFDALRNNPELCPKLKKLYITDFIIYDKAAMKLLREASKARLDLVIYLVSKMEEKNWGDWDLVLTTDAYHNGKKLAYGQKPKKKRV